jgi:hypothetical protein
VQFYQELLIGLPPKKMPLPLLLLIPETGPKLVIKLTHTENYIWEVHVDTQPGETIPTLML